MCSSDLQSMNFDVKYRPGKTNKVADALSRNPLLYYIDTLTIQLVEPEKLYEAYEEDKYFSDILKKLQGEQINDPKVIACVKYYELQDDNIFLKEGHRLAIPRDRTILTTVIKEHHDNPIAGHFRVDKTYENISRNFY